ncbi:MAG: adenine deaminase [bacterium]
MSNFSVSGNIVDLTDNKIYYGTVVVENGIIKDIIRQNHENENREKKTVNGNTGFTTQTSELETHKFILPGLIDSHIHIESSMLVPSEFARLAVTHGTVATVSDPHEIANVMGIDGVNFMIENGKKVPFKFYFGAPSCVPATTFETSGSTISTDDIRQLLSKDEIKYLSEMMNFPGVLYEFPEVMEKLRIAKKLGKPVDGHAPGMIGDDARKYISAGISTDHECFEIEEALEKISYGMKILIREGSAAKNFDTLHPLIKSHPDMLMFCSDDKHPDDLVKGHINMIVKKAVLLGYDIFDCLKIATLNPIKHYNLDAGLLQIGDSADFIIVDNLENFNILQTYISGIKVSENGKSLIESVEIENINNFKTNFKSIEEFAVEATGKKIRIIEAIEGQLFTNEIVADEKTKDANIISDTENDILKIAVVNRYKDTKPALGFIRNIGLKRGAIASSVAHDSHNIIVAGTTDEDLCCAVNAVIKNKGGLAVVDSGKIESLALPVAGLMTGEDGKKVAEKYLRLNEKVKALGSNLNAPFMTLSFMALLVIPKIKLSDKGLFSGEKFEFLDLHI